MTYKKNRNKASLRKKYPALKYGGILIKKIYDLIFYLLIYDSRAEEIRLGAICFDMSIYFFRRKF